jgi:hypothetical protein
MTKAVKQKKKMSNKGLGMEKHREKHLNASRIC